MRRSFLVALLFSFFVCAHSQGICRPEPPGQISLCEKVMSPHPWRIWHPVPIFLPKDGVPAEQVADLQAFARDACFLSPPCMTAAIKMRCALTYRPCASAIDTLPLPLCQEYCMDYNFYCQDVIATGQLEGINCDGLDPYKPQESLFTTNGSSTSCWHYPEGERSSPGVKGNVCPGKETVLEHMNAQIVFANNSASECHSVLLTSYYWLQSDPPQQLSPYFTRTDEYILPCDSFKNDQGAYVGCVLPLESFAITTDTTFQNITLTLGGPNGLMYLEKNLEIDVAVVTANNTLLPLELPSGVQYMSRRYSVFSTFSTGTYVPIYRSKSWKTDRPLAPFNRNEQATLYISASSYLLAMIVSALYIKKLFGRLHVQTLTVPSLWIIACLGVANLLRALYFFLLGAQVLSQSTAVDVALMEFPLMLRFSACLLMALFWIAVLVTYGGMDEGKLLRRFWVSFGVSNVLIYGLIVVIVGVFRSIRVGLTTRCGNDWLGYGPVQTLHDRRNAYVIYQSIIAAVGVITAAVFLIGGVLTARLLRFRQANQTLMWSNPTFRLYLVACVVATTLLALSLFLLLLALKRPNAPSLCLVLAALELCPEFLIYMNMSARDDRQQRHDEQVSSLVQSSGEAEGL